VVQREERLRFHQPRRHQGGRVCPPDSDYAQQPTQVPAQRRRRREGPVRHCSRREGHGGGQRDWSARPAGPGQQVCRRQAHADCPRCRLSTVVRRPAHQTWRLSAPPRHRRLPYAADEPRSRTSVLGWSDSPERRRGRILASSGAGVLQRAGARLALRTDRRLHRARFARRRTDTDEDDAVKPAQPSRSPGAVFRRLRIVLLLPAATAAAFASASASADRATSGAG